MKKLLTLIIIAVLLLFCREKESETSERITQYEIEKILNIELKSENDILENRIYNVDQSSALENIVVFRESEKIHLAVFSRTADGFRKISHFKTVDNAEFRKLTFLKTGSGYSHIVFAVKTDQNDISLYNSERHIQTFKLTDKEAVSFYIRENDSAPGDEMVQIGERLYRFDSFKYIEVFEDLPLPFLKKVQYSDKEGWIIMQNRGGYTGRAVITLTFPDLKNSDIPEKLALTRDIKTVKMYKAGRSLHYREGRRVTAKYPVIEIIKQPFQRMGNMRLPLKLTPNTGRIHIRAVFNYRGSLEIWPPSTADVEKGQQGYYVYTYPFNAQ